MTSRMHVVRPSVEVFRAGYSMDSMKRSMKSRCGDVFVVLRWWVDLINVALRAMPLHILAQKRLGLGLKAWQAICATTIEFGNYAIPHTSFFKLIHYASSKSYF